MGYGAQLCPAQAPQLFLLLVVAAGAALRGLAWALLPGTQVSDDFMCLFIVGCSFLVLDGVVWAV